ncbi:MAG: hypothetical protein ABW164_11425 [Sphingobium sp.]
MLITLFAPGVAHAEWREVVSPHFIVYSKGSARQTEQFATRLEKADRLLRLNTGIAESGNVTPLRIFLLDNIADVRGLTDVSSAAGFYSFGRRYAYAVATRRNGEGPFDLDAERILLHEYAHHFMHQYFPAAYPAWYVEGFAEFYSTMKFRPDGAIEFGLVPLYRAPGLLLGSVYPVAKLLDSRPARLSAEEGDRYYGTAWLLTHYLQFNEERRKELTAYLKGLSTGRQPDPEKSFAGGSKALQKELIAYMRRKLTLWIASGPMLGEASAISSSVLDDARAALIEDELRLLRQSDRDEEQPKRAINANRVRTIAARYPQSAIAATVLAETEMAAGAPDAALAAADRAIGLDPGAARAFAVRAAVLLARAEKSDADLDWKAALSAIVKANRADLEDPVPLILFHDYHRARGGQMPQVGFDGLYKALNILPQNHEYRLKLAQAMAERGHFMRASRLLDSLAYSPHETALRTHAIGFKAMLDAKAAEEPKPKP